MYTRHKNVYKKIGVCIAEVQNTVFVSLVLFFLVLITKPSKPVLKVKFKVRVVLFSSVRVADFFELVTVFLVN